MPCYKIHLAFKAMGNKFSNRTGVNLRPKVCKGPPSEPRPEPVPTPCCPAGTKQSLHFECIAAHCTDMFQVEGDLEYTGDAGGKWVATFYWPTITNEAVMQLACEEIIPGVHAWVLRWSGPFLDGGSATEDALSICSPIHLVFYCRMQLADLPEGCEGSEDRNFTIIIT